MWLPDRVKAPDGKVSLFADFSDDRGDHIVLYLVNKTRDRIAFATDLGDVHVRLEAADESGRWHRAQPYLASDCGLCYYVSPSLGPNEYFKFLGYCPANGNGRTVRYKMATDHYYLAKDKSRKQTLRTATRVPINLVSNPGSGRALDLDITKARYDKAALHRADLATVRELVLKHVSPPDSITFYRVRAIVELRRFPFSQTKAVFEALLDDEDAFIRAMTKARLREADQQ